MWDMRYECLVVEATHLPEVFRTSRWVATMQGSGGMASQSCLTFLWFLFIFRPILNRIPPLDIEAAKETLSQYLKERKLRPTRERFLLLEQILHTNGHFDADQLFASLANKGLKASRATVYNTLDLLVDCGLIS